MQDSVGLRPTRHSSPRLKPRAFWRKVGNQGKSRAPTLALLFLAKELRELPDDSYADARRGFDERWPGVYAPGAGIAAWLTEHWGEV